MLYAKDQFEQNQYFVVPDTAIINNFERFYFKHVGDYDEKRIEKLYYLQEYVKQSDFLGVVGFEGLHIFDKTKRMWITSSHKLGKNQLLKRSSNDF